jgi:thiol-disulfide isomerase/thioredoxin
MDKTIMLRRIGVLLVLVSLAGTVVYGLLNLSELTARFLFQEGLRTLDGEALDSPVDVLPDRGDLAFVVFWHSSCQACQKQMEVLNEWDIKNDAVLRSRVFVVTVNVGESEFAIRQFLAANDIDADFPVLLGQPLGGAVPTFVYVERYTTGNWEAFDSSEGYRSQKSLAEAAYRYLEYLDDL